MYRYKTTISQSPDGSVLFAKWSQQNDIALAWPLELIPGQGIDDVMRFHQGWLDEEHPPQSILLAGGRYLLIQSRVHAEWRREPLQLTVIGEVGGKLTLDYFAMTESVLRYFGFASPVER